MDIMDFYMVECLSGKENTCDKCHSDMMFDFEIEGIYCRRCRWKERSRAKVEANEGKYQPPLMGLAQSDIHFDPNKHFLTWIDRLLDAAPVSGFANISSLINKLRRRI